VKANIEAYCYVTVCRFLGHSEWGAGGVECSKSPQCTKNILGPPMSSVDLKQLSYPSVHIFSVLAAQVHDNLKQSHTRKWIIKYTV